jgi:hypothetical protein
MSEPREHDHLWFDPCDSTCPAFVEPAPEPRGTGHRFEVCLCGHHFAEHIGGCCVDGCDCLEFDGSDTPGIEPPKHPCPTCKGEGCADCDGTGIDENPFPTPGVEPERCAVPGCEASRVAAVHDPRCAWAHPFDPAPPVEQREQEGERWTILRCAKCESAEILSDIPDGTTTPCWDCDAGEMERIEVVPAANLTQAEAERDEWIANERHTAQAEIAAREDACDAEATLQAASEREEELKRAGNGLADAIRERVPKARRDRGLLMDLAAWDEALAPSHPEEDE